MSIFVYESVSARAPAAPGHPDLDLLEAGIAMRDAIVDDLAQLDGVAVTCAGGAPPTWRAANVATATPRDGETPEDFVARLAAKHDLSWIVAPETGGELARLQAVVGAARWIGCDAAAIRCAASKRATLAVLAAAGVPTPLDGAERHPGRWLVKPDDGAGCLATRVHRDHVSALATAALAKAAGDAVALEPFVEGEALSISMIVGADLAKTVSFNRQRIEIDAMGRLHDRGVQAGAIDAMTDARVARLDALAIATARALPGLGGFVGIDVVWNPQRGAVVIEVNPRVTCAYVGLSGKLGRNLAADILGLKALAMRSREHGHVVRA